MVNFICTGADCATQSISDNKRIKNPIFCDITPCSPLKFNRRFGGSACYLIHAGFLLGLFFDPENGSDIFLRNVS
jgi:hypothetical protein